VLQQLELRELGVCVRAAAELLRAFFSALLALGFRSVFFFNQES